MSLDDMLVAAGFACLVAAGTLALFGPPGLFGLGVVLVALGVGRRAFGPDESPFATCENCGARNHAGRDVCTECGKHL